MTARRPHLLLIGLRGSGKSTAGRRLAERAREAFTDLDREVLSHLRCTTVAEVWETLGEPAFRRAETEVLGTLLAGHPGIIALGGGTPTAPGAADLISEARASGRVRVVYLRCQPNELAARLRGAVGPDRPPLLGTDALTEMEEVFNRRDGLYQRLADVVIEGMASIEETVDGVERAWSGGQ
ncbi:MAG: hypothetical protein KDA21_12710 [Phycisphaerales bacterium]|nr:hypothetical protein [Phycisphaerales bacterium]